MENITRDQALQKYELALRMGRRFYDDKISAGQNGYLPNFEDLNIDTVESDIDLGVMDIPIKKIMGTRTTGRSTAFAGNFMPLLDKNTEFAQKWQALYVAHLSEGIREPIKVYEYMNYYYVQEGNKRVSVLKFTGASFVTAEVHRIIPTRTDDNENRIFFEFYDFDRRKIHNDLWFSKPGSFTKLISLARDFALLHPELRKDEKLSFIFECFSNFRLRYQSLGLGSLRITTGDAFLIFVELFGIPYKMEPGELNENIKKFAPYLKVVLAEKDPVAETSGHIAHRNALGGILASRRSHKPSVVFAYSLSPEYSFWSRTHDIARRRLSHIYGERLSLSAYWPQEDTTQNPDNAMLNMLDKLSSERPSVVFTTGPDCSRPTVKAAIKNPDVLFFSCTPEFDTPCVSTYFGRFYETCFISGVLAGALAKSSILGMVFPESTGMETAAINAFACGALTVNPRSRVLVARSSGILPQETGEARRKLARLGADIVLEFRPDSSSLPKQAIDEAFAVLCSVESETGNLVQFLGAQVVDWTVFYRAVVDELLNDSLCHTPVSDGGGQDTAHYRWGLSNGLTNLLVSNTAVTDYPVRLVKLFRQLLLQGAISPFNGMEGFDVPGISHAELYSRAQQMTVFTERVEFIDK